MTIKSIVAVAVAVALSTSAFAASVDTASAGERTKAKSTGMALQAKPDRGAHQTTSGSPSSGDLPNWTLACYAEFGPDAKYPDADLLEKCVN
ncbi:MAG: hypothetical protein AAGE89_00610 [Pseudomonadota bacterium]